MHLKSKLTNLVSNLRSYLSRFEDSLIAAAYWARTGYYESPIQLQNQLLLEYIQSQLNCSATG